MADRPERERRRIETDEAVLLRQADEVVVCSPELARRKGRDRSVHVVPNAVDLERYRRQQRRPDDLPPGPCVVYAGTLHRDRFDVDLVVRAAADVSDRATVVLVGPDALPPSDTERLRRHGVRLLGPRAYDVLPAYLQHAAVLVVPHVVDTFTAGLDPIKAYEYAAAGRPVLATPVAGFVDGSAGSGVTVAERATFTAELRRLLHPPTPDPRTADVPDWSVRVAAMAALLPG